MEGCVLSFLKAEWKVSDTGSAHWASSLYLKAWTVSKLCSYRHTLQPAINEMIEMVNKEEFTNSLSMLGLTSISKTENAAKDDSNKPTKYAKVSIDRILSLHVFVFYMKRNRTFAHFQFDCKIICFYTIFMQVISLMNQV